MLLTRIPKRTTEELGSLSKSEKVSLNRLCSRGRAEYASERNLSKASGLSKKSIEFFIKQDIVSDVSEDFKIFQNISMKFGVWT